MPVIYLGGAARKQERGVSSETRKEEKATKGVFTAFGLNASRIGRTM